MSTALTHFNIYKRWCLTWLPDNTSTIIFTRNSCCINLWNASNSEHKGLNKASLKNIYLFIPKLCSWGNAFYTHKSLLRKQIDIQQLSVLLRTNTFYKHHFYSITKNLNKENKENTGCRDISSKVESGVIW